MGHRANYILKESDGYRLFYSHWGANVIERDLFWGLDEAVRFITDQRATEEWLDDVWCEGGAALDFPARTLTFFGGEDLLYDPFLREAVLTLFRLSWNPWRVEWADCGILDLARVAGLEDREVLNKQEDRPELQEPTLSTASRKMCCSILQVDERRFALTNDAENWLPAGPGLLSKLPLKPPVLHLTADPPFGGGLVDSARKRLRYWNISGNPRLPSWVEDAWKGWTVERDETLAVKQTEEFFQMAGLKAPTFQDTLARYKDMLLAQIGSRALTLESLAAQHGPEARIELNPLATEDHRLELDGESRLHYLNAVLARLRP